MKHIFCREQNKIFLRFRKRGEDKKTRRSGWNISFFLSAGSLTIIEVYLTISRSSQTSFIGTNRCSTASLGLRYYSLIIFIIILVIIIIIKIAIIITISIIVLKSLHFIILSVCGLKLKPTNKFILIIEG